MNRRLFASILTMSAFLVFLLFGSLRLQWHQAPQNPLWVNVSLGFKIPPTALDSSRRSLPETLQDEFMRVFGEAPHLGQAHSGTVSGVKGFASSSNLPSPSPGLHSPRVITLKSVWTRLTQMIQLDFRKIEQPHTQPTAQAIESTKPLI